MPDLDAAKLQELEDGLRAQLAAVAENCGGIVADAAARTQAAAEALTTAGSEYQGRIVDAEEGLTASINAYDQFLADLDAQIQTTDAAIEQISSGGIPAITARNVAATDPGEGDCLAEDVNTEFAALVGEVQALREAVSAQLDQVKEALSGVKSLLELLRQSYAPIADIEGQKAAARAEIEGML